jgi:uroporphyrinogen-III synthase
MWLAFFIFIFSLQDCLGYCSFSSPFVKKLGLSSLYAGTVGLTREKESNKVLKDLLVGVNCLEVPCIQFADGPDKENLAESIDRHDCIVVTSPHSASVLIDCLKTLKSLKPEKVKVATIGKGTSKVLLTDGIHPCFESTDATGDSLAAELPEICGKTVLYPSSALADDSVVEILTKRGFQVILFLSPVIHSFLSDVFVFFPSYIKVTRLKTYTTIPAEWSQEDFHKANSVDLVTFASPSTIKVWKERIGITKPVVVIGRTCRKAAETAGFQEIYCPDGDSKGLQPWADLIMNIVREKDV